MRPVTIGPPIRLASHVHISSSPPFPRSSRRAHLDNERKFQRDVHARVIAAERERFHGEIAKLECMVAALATEIEKLEHPVHVPPAEPVATKGFADMLHILERRRDDAA